MALDWTRASPLLRLARVRGLLSAALVVAAVACDAGQPAAAPSASPAPNSQPAAAAPAAPVARVAFLDIIRASDNPLRVFELKPNLRAVRFKGAPTSTNSHGFRYREVAPDEGPDTITIVGIGDSMMFGWGVADGLDYLSLLERALQAKYPAKTWRVINLSVPAYNTVMEVETFATAGLQFDPDLVILHLLPNDLVLPEYVLRSDGGGATDAAHPERDQRLQPVAEVDPQDEAFRDLVGWLPFEQALDRLRDLSAAHDFPVVLFTSAEDELTLRMIAEAVERGCLPVSLVPEIEAHLLAKYKAHFSMQSPQAYLQSDLVYAKGDSHPSILQHQMSANKLLQQLEADGVIARIMR